MIFSALWPPSPVRSTSKFELLFESLNSSSNFDVDLMLKKRTLDANDFDLSDSYTKIGKVVY